MYGEPLVRIIETLLPNLRLIKMHHGTCSLVACLSTDSLAEVSRLENDPDLLYVSLVPE